jgi:hypothetical protein
MSQEVWPYLLGLLEERVALGEARYGCRLATDNGRDALRDAWEEAVDLVMYLTQMMMEREGTPASKKEG